MPQKIRAIAPGPNFYGVVWPSGEGFIFDASAFYGDPTERACDYITQCLQLTSAGCTFFYSINNQLTLVRRKHGVSLV